MLNVSLADKILVFALPLAVTGILQQLFNAADIAVVGRFVGKNAMAAVGSNSPIIALIINLFTGISVGANIVIAKFIGQNRPDGVKRAVHTALTFAVLSGTVFACICELLSRSILRLMSIPDNVFDMALLYFRVYIGGMPVILLYDFASAIFRSRGNTRTPLICLLVSGLINVVLNLFFVIVLKMTVNGVALATVSANLISSALLIYFLSKDNSEIHFSFRELGIDRYTLNGVRSVEYYYTVLNKQAGRGRYGGFVSGFQYRDIRILHNQRFRSGLHNFRRTEPRCKQARKMPESYTYRFWA